MKLPIEKLTARLERLKGGDNFGLVYHGVYARRGARGFRISDPLRHIEMTFDEAGEAAVFIQTLSRYAPRPTPAA